LKIVKRGDRYFLTDLRSRNGTFFDRAYLYPGAEVQAKEGVLIAVGMSVICLGKGCIEQAISFQDTMELKKEIFGQTAALEDRRRESNEEKLDFLNKVSGLLTKGIPITEALEQILGHIFDLLKRIDRSAFILVDPNTRVIKQTVSRSDIPGNKKVQPYSKRVVDRVLKEKKPVVISNVQTEEDELVDTLKVLKIECVMCVPISFGSDIFGVIYLDSRQRPYGFRESDVSVFIELGQQVAIFMEKERFVSEISRAVDTLSSDH
jgi:transcriptional regulator with GAF, ATPase, and Fis domain